MSAIAYIMCIIKQLAPRYSELFLTLVIKTADYLKAKIHCTSFSAASLQQVRIKSVSSWHRLRVSYRETCLMDFGRKQGTDH